VYKIWTKNSQPLGKKCQKISGGLFLTHTVVRKITEFCTSLYMYYKISAFRTQSANGWSGWVWASIYVLNGTSAHERPFCAMNGIHVHMIVWTLRWDWLQVASSA